MLKIIRFLLPILFVLILIGLFQFDQSLPISPLDHKIVEVILLAGIYWLVWKLNNLEELHYLQELADQHKINEKKMHDRKESEEVIIDVTFSGNKN